ncbi:hypothetical protein SAMN05216196_108127 [Lutimaribacter pacificus]|uniref:Uncharacterized protein n=1 Tax=Lutimaribacter pacificus TaxID=391948 RepID=A0A1H0LT54_9RHOB|nr:hypothetical protein [Lutimaribacter pacificus]SDO71357.1 hypothetical protein SAMN05216196_108127 [Lutimaribacter pacificus]SHK03596.1 hypothetical protein SAMN05444142_10330 [Lutimaribacter pacificus]
MLRHMVIQLSIGALLATAFLLVIIWVAAPTSIVLLREALERPDQLPAIWLGAIAPFSICYLGTALIIGEETR